MPHGRRRPPPELLELSAELECIAGRRVDLAFLSGDNVVFAKEAVAKGRLLDCANPWAGRSSRCIPSPITPNSVSSPGPSWPPMEPAAMNDVLLNKAGIVERCLGRIAEERLLPNWTTSPM